MTFTIYSFRNLHIYFLPIIIYFLLPIRITQGRKVRSGEVCEITESPQEEQDLRENADIASLIAVKAAEEAKDASEAQNEAGAEAALEVKEELAERAEDAARAAQAALAGKEAIVDELQQQIKQYEEIIRDQTTAQQHISKTSKLTLELANKIDGIAKALQNVVQMAHDASDATKCIAADIEKEANNKCSTLEQSRRQLNKLIAELKESRADLDKTLEATKKAVDAAKSAEKNAENYRLHAKRSVRRKFHKKNKIR